MAEITDPNPLPVEPPLLLTPEALFRYQVVSQVLAAVYGGRRLSVAVREIAARMHLSFDGSYRAQKVSRRSVYRWLRAFEAGGVRALEPAVRSTTLTSVALPPEFIEFLRSEKTTDPEASVPEIIRRASLRGIWKEDDPPDRTIHPIARPFSARPSAWVCLSPDGPKSAIRTCAVSHTQTA
jgi:transposase